MTLLNAALEYLEEGLSVIPIRPDTKRPCIRWKEYQSRQATEEEVEEWFRIWPDAYLAVVTGAVSGVLVVDCDNDEAFRTAVAAGMRSPVMVKTKRGCHLWFKDPADGQRRGPRAGNNSTGADWPRVNGLDFRGDGSYALLPPSKNYEWSVPEGLDRQDDMPVWKDWSPAVGTSTADAFVFEKLDLSTVRFNPAELMTEWERTEAYIREQGFPGGRIPTGQSNGRNERVMRYAAECVLQGMFGAELRVRARAFMDKFFVDHLPEFEYEATISSVEQMERRNHPERFDPNTGDYVYKRPGPGPEEDTKPRRLVTVADAEDLIQAGEGQEYLIEPWLAPQTIVQVHGYSGSGKTMFLQHALYAMASGARYFGPYEINRAAKTLYMDFELSRGDLGRRLVRMRSVFGDAEDRFSVWAPWITGEELSLSDAAGLQELQAYIEFARPDVVVIDTIRSAWSGLAENDASAWSPINKLAVRLRNAGIAVVMLHHSNKPGEDGLGREAGSSNQLTVVETQIRIAQVYQDEETAKQKSGIWNEKYSVPPFENLQAKLTDEWYIEMVLEVRYGKVREWTHLHDAISFIGWATHRETGEARIVSSFSTKQKAKEMALDGQAPADIAQALFRPMNVISRWLGLEDQAEKDSPEGEAEEESPGPD